MDAFLTDTISDFQDKKEKKYPKEHHYYIDHQALAVSQLKSMSATELDEDWMLYDFFGSIYVINLPEETKRLERTRKALEQVGVKDFVVFPAIRGSQQEERVWKQMSTNWVGYNLSSIAGQKAFDKQSQAETGCYLSHLKVLEIMRNRFEEAKKLLESARQRKNPIKIKKAEKLVRQCSSVLIIEDDNSFGIVNPDLVSANLSGVGTIFRKAMKKLPQNWEMVYFMAHSMKPSHHFSRHLVKNTQAIYLNAYAVNHLMYDTLINLLSKIYHPDNTHLSPIDYEISLIQESHQTFSVTPSIAYQVEGLSSITSNDYKIYRQMQP